MEDGCEDERQQVVNFLDEHQPWYLATAWSTKVKKKQQKLYFLSPGLWADPYHQYSAEDPLHRQSHHAGPHKHQWRGVRAGNPQQQMHIEFLIIYSINLLYFSTFQHSVIEFRITDTEEFAK